MRSCVCKVGLFLLCDCSVVMVVRLVFVLLFVIVSCFVFVLSLVVCVVV